MRQGIQTLCKELGADGCYVFALFELSECIRRSWQTEPVLVPYTEYGIKQGWIREHDMFLLNPSAFLSALTLRNFSVRVEGADYAPKEGEWEVLHGMLKEDGGRETEHFRLPDWDSVGHGVFTLLDTKNLF